VCSAVSCSAVVLNLDFLGTPLVATLTLQKIAQHGAKAVRSRRNRRLQYCTVPNSATEVGKFHTAAKKH
jgi:hypothetical protein